MSTNRSLAIDAYHIGIVCALPHEMAAVRAMLDEEDQPLPSQHSQDFNSYVLGRMSQHNVVIACLPAGVYGTTTAATVSQNMLRTFTELRVALLVGIGGGVPDIQAGRDIRLGDVVISQPDGTFGGVVQYDMGKSYSDGHFIRKGALNSPPQVLLTVLAQLRSGTDLAKSQLEVYLTEAYERYPVLADNGYVSPGVDMDQLYCSRCQPSRWWWLLWLLMVWLCPLLRCGRCVDSRQARPYRRGTMPVVHYGTIASGNQVIKNATLRDHLGQELDALCVEMEAAGLMNTFPCIVIRGICDYADSHKNDVWQKYAAMAAAAYAKDFLQHVTPGDTSKQQRILDVVGK